MEEESSKCEKIRELSGKNESVRLLNRYVSYGLPAEHDARTESHCKGGGHDESAAFYTHDFCYAFVFVYLIEFLLHDAQAFGAFEQCCYVSEVDSLDGEVRYASEVFE